MAKTDRTKTKKLPVRVAKLLESLSIEALEDILGEEGAVAALDEAFALTMAALEGGTVWLSDDECKTASGAERAAFVRRLLTAKLDPNRTSPRFDPPLMAVLGAAEIDDKGALAKELLQAGADPNLVTPVSSTKLGDRTPLGRASKMQDKAAIALLLPLANAASKADALITTIERIGANAKLAKQFEEWLSRVEDVDGPGPSGHAPVHAAALMGSAAMLGKVLARSKNPQIAVSFTGEYPVLESVAPEGGVVPTIAVRPGMNALDLVIHALELVERKAKEYAARDKAPQKQMREEALERLKANRAALEKAGLAPAAPAPAAANGDKKEYHRIIDEQFLRLASLVGADKGKAEAAIGRVDATKLGPWGYLVEIAGHLNPLLQTQEARAALGKTRLLWVLFTSSDISGLRDVDAVKAKNYPKEARDAIGQGFFIGRIDATVFMLWQHTKGVPIPARVCRAHPETFEVLGDSVDEFLRNEVNAVAQA